MLRAKLKKTFLISTLLIISLTTTALANTFYRETEVPTRYQTPDPFTEKSTKTIDTLGTKMTKDYSKEGYLKIEYEDKNRQAVVTYLLDRYGGLYINPLVDDECYSAEPLLYKEFYQETIDTLTNEYIESLNEPEKSQALVLKSKASFSMQMAPTALEYIIMLDNVSSQELSKDAEGKFYYKDLASDGSIEVLKGDITQFEVEKAKKAIEDKLPEGVTLQSKVDSYINNLVATNRIVADLAKNPCNVSNLVNRDSLLLDFENDISKIKTIDPSITPAVETAIKDAYNSLSSGKKSYYSAETIKINRSTGLINAFTMDNSNPTMPVKISKFINPYALVLQLGVDNAYDLLSKNYKSYYGKKLAELQTEIQDAQRKGDTVNEETLKSEQRINYEGYIKSWDTVTFKRSIEGLPYLSTLKDSTGRSLADIVLAASAEQENILANNITGLSKTEKELLDTQYGLLDNQINLLSSKVDALDTKVTNLENRVSALELAVDNIEKVLNSLTTKISGVEDKLKLLNL